MERWNPRQELTKAEQRIMSIVQKRRRLFAFLRLHRHEIFDEAFQRELESMYKFPGRGSDPVPPALLCMVILLQAYLQISDADAVDMAVMDARWQLVLGCLGAETAPFSQGGLQRFRERLIAADMDQRLLERTIEIAKRSKGFDWKKLPKDLRIAIDSRPLEGAGRVEDTINLLGHAARKVVSLASALLDMPVQAICEEAEIPLLLHPSVKAGLDLDWNDPVEKRDAVEILCGQITSLASWVEGKRIANEAPLKPYLEAIAQVQAQDLEIASDGSVKLREGVAEDRRVSIEDQEMRHGRKTKSKRFNGYKEHVALDLDTDLIFACDVTPANRPDEEAAPRLKRAVERQGVTIDSLHLDRGYINSDAVDDVVGRGGEVVCKPWKLRGAKPDLFSKADFKLNMRDKTITCPAGHIEHFEPGNVVEFDPEVCGPCPMRGQCTHSASGRGRTVSIGIDESLQHRLRKMQQSKAGRARLRERTAVEHSLAHIAARKGRKARYRGTRRNLFDLRRTAAVQNLETIQRRSDSHARAA